jgi:fumarate hydratase class I
VGGAAQVLADKVVEVRNVFFTREFGLTEAMWVLELKDFPAIVAIDTHGRSLLRRVQNGSRRVLRKLMDAPEHFVP